MARHGENIRKRTDGRWEGRYPVYNKEKGKQIYCSVYGRTYEEVREKLTAKKNLLKAWAEASEQTHTCPMPPSFGISFTEAAQGWLAQVREKRKLSTYIKYSLIYQKYMEQEFENTALSEMTVSFVKDRLADSLSGSVCKSVYCVLNQILKYASARYSLTLAPLQRPDSGIPPKAIRVLSKSDQKKLIAVLFQKMNLSKLAVLLVLYTGLRLGELCSLKWTDIDFEGRVLSVSRTVQRLYAEGQGKKTVLLETAPKSQHSLREIPLSDKLLNLLAKFHSDREYVFGGDKPMEPRTMQYHFKKILAEAALADTNFHILRHTFSTNCIENGMDVKSLSEMLGHSDVQITLNRYVHPSMDTKRKYMDSLSVFYGQIYGQAG